MIILFPKRKGIKIATTLIHKALLEGAAADYVKGMIGFALGFGAINAEEAEILTQYLEERG